jgi:heme/copper-type cytochrome/quinol oxidase subunit 2
MSENANLDGAGAPQGNGMATASLILGICSIVLFWLSFIGIVCGVLAIIFAVVAKNKIKANPNTAGVGSAKAGLITGIIGIAIWLVMVIVVAVFLTSAVGVFEEAIQNSNDLQDALNELENYN